jgi:hypothetical protein
MYTVVTLALCECTGGRWIAFRIFALACDRRIDNVADLEPENMTRQTCVDDIGLHVAVWSLFAC